jgi:hypothetical protein
MSLDAARTHPKSVAVARAVTTVAASLVLAFAAACSSVDVGKLVPTYDPDTSAPPAELTGGDFQGVCSGATASRATAFDPQAQSHKVILFSPLNGSLVEDTSMLPTDWTVQYSQNSDAYVEIDLVACIQVTDEQPLKECTGYEDNGAATGNRVNLRAATYSLSVRSAVTAKELGRTELSTTDDTCPMFMSFDDGTQVKTYDVPPPKDDVVAFVKQFAQP